MAVLLDSFVTASLRMLEEERQRQLAESKSRKTISSTLDPLLERLARDFVDNADLSSRLQNLFKVLCAVLQRFNHCWTSSWEIARIHPLQWRAFAFAFNLTSATRRVHNMPLPPSSRYLTFLPSSHTPAPRQYSCV